MNLIRLSDRLARLEQQRRGTVPGLRRLTEVSARLIEAADGLRDLDEILAASAQIEAARRGVAP